MATGTIILVSSTSYWFPRTHFPSRFGSGQLFEDGTGNDLENFHGCIQNTQVNLPTFNFHYIKSTLSWPFDKKRKGQSAFLTNACNILIWIMFCLVFPLLLTF